MELAEKLHFYLPFAKTIGSFTCLAAKLARIFRAKTAKMARIFRVKTAKRIGIFSKYLQNWHE